MAYVRILSDLALNPTDKFVKSRPILFSAPMVRSLLANRKTQTRRIVKPQPGLSEVASFGSEPAIYWQSPQYDNGDGVHYFHTNLRDGLKLMLSACPYGKPGDHLWVRENLRRTDLGQWVYAADRNPVLVSPESESAMLVWAHYKEQDYCPSIHMPRWASRITLEITEVLLEQLQSITEEDAIAEGCDPWGFNPDQTLTSGERAGDSPYRSGYAYLWDEINDERATWRSNPWVWVISSKRVEVAQ